MNPITVQDILEAGKHASLTGSVLTEWAEKGTPNNDGLPPPTAMASFTNRSQQLPAAA